MYVYNLRKSLLGQSLLICGVTHILLLGYVDDGESSQELSHVIMTMMICMKRAQCFFYYLRQHVAVSPKMILDSCLFFHPSNWHFLQVVTLRLAPVQEARVHARRADGVLGRHPRNEPLET